MRTLTKAVLLRLSDSDFRFLQACAYERSMNVQEYLRDLLKYGTLPHYALPQAQNKPHKSR
jgi:predicted DNA binding CopG/RHH family protein